MNKDKYVFSQLIEFLNNDKFRRLSERYGGDCRVKYFSCWSQLLTLMFAQLSGRESLRDLIVVLTAHRKKMLSPWTGSASSDTFHASGCQPAT